MANSRNPSNNSILQALRDAADLGYGSMSVDHLATKIANDPKLASDLQKRWNAHAYPERSMTWAQLAIDQRIFGLSGDALKVATLLGMYAHQTGMIQIRRNDIVAATGIKLTAVKQAIADLVKCGAILVVDKSRRHNAPIYRVNPALIAKGVRHRAATSDYVDKLQIPPEKYLFNAQPDLVAQVETIRTDDGIVYNRFGLAPPDPDEDSTSPKTSHHKKSTGASYDPVPGQMSVYDYPDMLPASKETPPAAGTDEGTAGVTIDDVLNV